MRQHSTPEELVEPERYELCEAPRYRFDMDRRDFCKVLGGGIVVCLALPNVQGQESGREGAPRRGRGRGRGFGGRVPKELGAWLHLGNDGRITVFTGKVEIGQNIRTSLAQAVADELRITTDPVQLVMADTALVPFDMGTFGSMTTRMMAPQLRRAAATARELLVDLAAKKLGVDRGTVVWADGKATHAASRRSLSIAELSEKQALTKVIDGEAAVTPARQWKTAGASVPKVDGRAIVTGGHRYASDIRRPGMLFGKVLRPAELHASLRSVDVKAARALPGVTAVADGNFVGVAAPTLTQAEQALEAIHADWEPATEPVSDRKLFVDLKRQGGQRGASRGGERSFFGRSNYSRGSIETGLGAAKHKLRTTYKIAYIAHVPLEPRAAVAEWSDGKLTVWTGTQRPFGVQGDLAGAFGISADKVRVIVPDMGSGYGGKHTGEAAVEAARLAKAAGKPVKLVWTRQEEFTWGYFRPAGVIDVEAGVDKDGLLTAWDYANYNSGGAAIRPLYEIPNQRVAFHASRAPLRQGSYRALAATANHFARESHIDALARAAGQDPLQFRLKNLKDARLKAVLQAAAGKFGWEPGKNLLPGHGHGIAGGSEKGSYIATCAEVAVDPNGKVRVVRAVSAFECGAIVNPDGLRNQVEGAVVMGLGGALFEAVQFDADKITNPRLSRYRVPRFSDVPVLETVLLNRADLPSVGAGETPIVAIAPAVANAIFQATGKRLTDLPLAPRGVKSQAT